MFIIKDLFKQFNQLSPAINHISFEINDNEVFGIVGKSGVGKSTLMRLLSLQLAPDKGLITYDGKVISNLSLNNKNTFIHKTSFIYQNFVLLYNLTVLENVMLPLKIRGIDKVTREHLANELLKKVGLQEKALSYPITLSGGESQRVAIARALITKPEVLFCDEITSALDSITTFEILDLLKKLKLELNFTIIFVSHDISAIKYICDRVLLLDEGNIKRIDSVKKDLHIINTYESLIWGNHNE